MCRKYVQDSMVVFQIMKTPEHAGDQSRSCSSNFDAGGLLAFTERDLINKRILDDHGRSSVFTSGCLAPRPRCPASLNTVLWLPGPCPPAGLALACCGESIQFERIPDDERHSKRSSITKRLRVRTATQKSMHPRLAMPKRTSMNDHAVRIVALLHLWLQL